MVRSTQLQVLNLEAVDYAVPAWPAYETSIGNALLIDGAVRAPVVMPYTSPYQRVGLDWALWQEAPLTRWVPEPILIAQRLIEDSMRAVDAATPRLRTLARGALQAALFGMGRWVLEHHEESRAPLERFAVPMLYRTRRNFLRRYGARRLWMELRDECQRNAAREDPHARATYLAWWHGRIAALQRRFSWRVPGYTGEDVAGELLAELIKAIDSFDDAPFLSAGGPGVEGTFAFLVRRKDSLRRRQQIRQVVPREAYATLGDRTPTAEELMLAREKGVEADAVLARANSRLSPRRRLQLEAVLEDAREHGYVSEVRLAERLGVHKSSVSRALGAILTALQKSGATDLLEGIKLGAPRAKRRLWRDDGDERPKKRGRIMLIPASPSRPSAVAPQPPWLNPGDEVRLTETGQYGTVAGVDHCIIGPLYTVRVAGRERTDIPRDALEYLRRFQVPF